jgi:hypothetical protein
MAIGMVAALASVAAAPAHACWSASAVEAAQMRDFETMLMVSALRCRLKGVDFLGDYNRFVSSKRATLTAVNDELRGQFNRTMGGKAALDAYDRYVTSLANSFGGESNGYGCEELAAMAAGAAEAADGRATLLALAQRAGADPRLPEERCAVTVAVAAR